MRVAAATIAKALNTIDSVGARAHAVADAESARAHAVADAESARAHAGITAALLATNQLMSSHKYFFVV